MLQLIPSQCRIKVVWSKALPLWALLLAVAAHIAIFIVLRDEIAQRTSPQATAISVQMIDLIPASPSTAAPAAPTRRA